MSSSPLDLKSELGKVSDKALQVSLNEAMLDMEASLNEPRSTPKTPSLTSSAAREGQGAEAATVPSLNTPINTPKSKPRELNPKSSTSGKPTSLSSKPITLPQSLSPKKTSTVAKKRSNPRKLVTADDLDFEYLQKLEAEAEQHTKVETPKILDDSRPKNHYGLEQNDPQEAVRSFRPFSDDTFDPSPWNTVDEPSVYRSGEAAFSRQGSDVTDEELYGFAFGEEPITHTPSSSAPSTITSSAYSLTYLPSEASRVKQPSLLSEPPVLKPLLQEPPKQDFQKIEFETHTLSLHNRQHNFELLIENIQTQLLPFQNLSMYSRLSQSDNDKIESIYQLLSQNYQALHKEVEEETKLMASQIKNQNKNKARQHQSIAAQALHEKQITEQLINNLKEMVRLSGDELVPLPLTTGSSSLRYPT